MAHEGPEAPIDGNPWQSYGLSDNPFFIQPLVDEKLALFRGEGRRDVATTMTAHIGSGGSSVLLLEGGPGVGKTTLVNFVKESLGSSDRFYVHPGRIELSVDSTRETLAAELLAALTMTALSAEPSAGWEDDPRWAEVHETIADTWENSGYGLGGAFAGFGANLSRTQIRRIAKEMPWSTWKSLVSNIIDAMTERRDRILVHLNNIDAVSDQNPQAIRQVFDEARELFIEPGLTTVLCASSSFRNEVIADRQRLLDVITTLPGLDQLDTGEFIDAVMARYEYFRLDDVELVEPVEASALETLYEVFEGDMRNTFKVAHSSLVEASVSQTEPSPLTLEDILGLYASRLWTQYMQLPESERAIVAFLLEEGAVSSQGDLAEGIQAPQPTVSQASRRVENKRWISTSKQGSRLSYELSGYGALLERAMDLGLLDDPMFW